MLLGFLTGGFKPTLMRNMQLFANKDQSHTKKKGKLTMQCDELWSFVDNKGNKQLVRLALDVKTREIVGVYIGYRDEKAARKLGNCLP